MQSISKATCFSLPFHISNYFRSCKYLFHNSVCYSKLKNNFWKKEVAWIEQIPGISVLIWVDSSMIVLYTKLKQQKRREQSSCHWEALHPPLLAAVGCACILQAFFFFSPIGKEAGVGRNTCFLTIIHICVLRWKDIKNKLISIQYRLWAMKNFQISEC